MHKVDLSRFFQGADTNDALKRCCLSLQSHIFRISPVQLHEHNVSGMFINNFYFFNVFPWRFTRTRVYVSDIRY